MLPPDAGTILCAIARAAISGSPEPSPSARSDTESRWLDEPGAAFVTLTEHGRLRGCIGTLIAYRPLRRDVADNAVAAATRDPRFPPVRAPEIPGLAIEVSVLSTPVPLTIASEQEARERLVPHVDGVILTYRHHRGTFLPQVWEQLPEPAEFLTHLKQKAGLDPDWWHPDVRLERYTVTAFHEPADRS